MPTQIPAFQFTFSSTSLLLLPGAAEDFLFTGNKVNAVCNNIQLILVDNSEGLASYVRLEEETPVAHAHSCLPAASTWLPV